MEIPSSPLQFDCNYSNFPFLSSKLDDFFDFSHKFAPPLSPINLPDPEHSFSESSSTKKPAKNGTAWTCEEDERLSAAVQQFNARNWKAIAKRVPGRTFSQCAQRWRRLQPHKTRQPWTKSEDKAIVSLFERFGNNWTIIASFLEGRTGKQVRDRFRNKLDPKINRRKFSEKEDLIIVQKFKEIGPKWLQISKELPGRSENMIKNRFYSYLKKSVRESPEDAEKCGVKAAENRKFVEEIARNIAEERKCFEDLGDEAMCEEEMELRNVKEHVEFLKQKKQLIENSLELLKEKIEKYEHFMRTPAQ